LSPRVKDVVGLFFRLVLAAILGYAGLTKVFEEDGARTAIMAYRVFPVEWTGVLGWALPTLEILLAGLLLVGLFTRWAALVSGLLMTAFIVGIASVWIRGYSIDCGCFGGGGDITSEGRTWRYSSEILRDLMFAGMAVWLTVRPRTLWGLDREPLTNDEAHHDYPEDSERQV
jgi:uncharacterized membrane protein YphA (DoxX/SURF4 family)